VVTGFAELVGLVFGEGDLSKVGEVVAVSLVSHVDFCVVLESFEEAVVPDLFVCHWVSNEMVVVTTARAEARGSGESIDLFLHRASFLVKGGIHGAAHIRAVSRGDDRVFHRNGSADRDDGLASASGTGIRHDRSADDNGGFEQLIHLSGDGFDIGFLVLVGGLDGFSEGKGAVAHFDFGVRFPEFAFEKFKEVFAVADSSFLVFSDSFDKLPNKQAAQ